MNNDLKTHPSPTLTKEDHYIADERQFDIAVLGQKALATKNLIDFINELLILVSDALGTEYVKILKLTEDKKHTLEQIIARIQKGDRIK